MTSSSAVVLTVPGASVAAGVQVRAEGWGWRPATRRQPSLVDLDFVIEPGERVLLLGPSGAGKSTLLAGLAGLLSAEDGDEGGRLLVGGSPAAARIHRPGLVLQDPLSQIVLSRVGDEVAFGAENLGASAADIARRVPEALAAVGLDLPLDTPTAQLSGGQQQRLALATALAMQPGLLLLDEPTANIDPAGALAVRDAVANSLNGRTLVVVEHRVELWLPVIDRVLVLDAQGRLIADGQPERVLVDHAAALRGHGVWLPGEVPLVEGVARVSQSSADPTPRVPPLLRTERLSIGREPGRALQRDVVHELHDGDIVWLGGENGAGKTTLLHTLGGLIAPLAGDVLMAPELCPGRVDRRRARTLRVSSSTQLAAAPFAWRSRDLAVRIGSVFQHPEHQFSASTVADELAQRPDLIDQLGLAKLAQTHPTTLSGGQKRRLSVGIALAARPRLLLLDEPTFGQDARTWAALAELLLEAQRDGATLLFASHDQALADCLATGRWLLERPGS